MCTKVNPNQNLLITFYQAIHYLWYHSLLIIDRLMMLYCIPIDNVALIDYVTEVPFRIIFLSLVSTWWTFAYSTNNYSVAILYQLIKLLHGNFAIPQDPAYVLIEILSSLVGCILDPQYSKTSFLMIDDVVGTHSVGQEPQISSIHTYTLLHPNRW